MMRPFKLGLTGSIGMGKSTTASFFREAGIPVWDADAAVHRLYQADGLAVQPIAQLVPDAVDETGVNRPKLKESIKENTDLLTQLEAIVHPLVAQDRNTFIKCHDTAVLMVFDIPLLFETDADQWLDKVLVVTAPPDVQRSRVLKRSGMTEQMLNKILARQMPDPEKKARADYVIDTSSGLESARRDVITLINKINAEWSDA